MIFSRDLPVIRETKTKRISSWDRTGGNRDFVTIMPNERKIIAEIEGSGCINHFWTTIGCLDRLFLKKLILRAFWDNERKPSVEVPLGDFFGIGNPGTKAFSSLMLCANPSRPTWAEDRPLGLNSYFPMPFSNGARLEIENDGITDIFVYFHLDYEEYENLNERLGRFHAQWRRENPTNPIIPDGIFLSDSPRSKDERFEKYVMSGNNTTGKENYVILEAEGRGHYIGCILYVDNFNGGWYGEGDDMIFIDGEAWPPSIHGTGLEDYFCSSGGPQEEYCSPYSGLVKVNPNHKGEETWFRFHITDPIRFKSSIKVTIEHGHANNKSVDFTSVGYWYQEEPHKEFPKIPPVEQRLPNISKAYRGALDKWYQILKLLNEKYPKEQRELFFMKQHMNPLIKKINKALSDREYQKAKEYIEVLRSSDQFQ